MISALRAYLTGNDVAHPWEASDLTGAIIVGIDRESSSKITCLFFGQTGIPTVAAKVARDAAGERSLAAEHSVLLQLSRTGATAIRDCAPKPIALARIAGRLSLLTTAVAGGPMSARYYSPGHVADPVLVAEDFDAASSWLRRFHTETKRGEAVLDENSVEAWTSQVVDRYREKVGWSETEERLFTGVRARGRDLTGTTLPIVAVHGDYWMGNLLLTGRRVSGVVDWELGREAGLPFTDIYKFPTSYAFYLDRSAAATGGDVPGHPNRAVIARTWSRYGDWPNLVGFGYGYFSDGWFPERVRRFVLGHLSALGVPAAVNGVFFPLYLAQQAMALDVPAFRAGYRSLLCAFAHERSSTWMWGTDVHTPLGTR